MLLLQFALRALLPMGSRLATPYLCGGDIVLEGCCTWFGSSCVDVVSRRIKQCVTNLAQSSAFGVE